MTVVFVHGVPETPAVWERLRRELGRLDVVAVQLPGFGSARPDGFGSTKEEYVDFLVGELERVADEPVDIVGHDWAAASWSAW
jgi:pimeloyl-ACP methyl ester carboxylesterase